MSRSITLEAGCPVCRSGRTVRFLERRSVPVHQNMPMDSQAAARAIERGNLSMSVCEDCSFVFNTAFIESKLSYGKSYNNAQTHSVAFRDYLSSLIRALIQDKRVRDGHIVEVGCGNGWFLAHLVGAEGSSNTGCGFDPSYVGPDSVLGGRLRFERRTFEPGCGAATADVVVCRHVIEHTPDPVGLLRAVRSVARPDARLFFETPCARWILRNQVTWDFFYEHCSYFSAESIPTAFALAGLRVHGIQREFGEQYLWVEGAVGAAEEAPTHAPSDVPGLAKQFGKAEEAIMKSLGARVRHMAQGGKVAIWGAGAKGVTFANLIDSDCCWIDCVVDVNPDKQGRFVPGTGHPIVSPEDLGRHGVRMAILMNPNYRQENVAMLGQLGVEVELADLQCS